MWVIGLVAGLLLLFSLLLFVPVDVALLVERDDCLKWRMKTGWMFGLIKKEFGGDNSRSRDDASDEKKRKAPGRNSRSILEAVTTAGFPERVISSTRDVLRAVKVREFRAGVRIGLGDPVATGTFLAFAVPLLAVVRSLSSVNIQVEPDFERERLDGYCKVDARAVPVKLVRP
ncbi:MAG: DUF2953 domain-containing protein, partial [Chloroflexi bacterium]|nr:DUF2953 domain-containing protein [Chloroflexota bacterium]